MIKYNIDFFKKINNEEILISGWAFSSNNELKITSPDLISIEKKNRPDVINSYKDKFDNIDIDCGFNLTIKSKSGRAVFKLNDGDEEIIYKAGLLKIKLENFKKSILKIHGILKVISGKIDIVSLKSFFSYFVKFGFKKSIKKIFNSFNKFDRQISYFKNNQPDKNELINQANYKFDYRPLISILVPAYNTPVVFLKQLLDSVINQTYSNWELCIADGSSNDETVKFLKNSADLQKNIKIVFLGSNLGIAGNTKKAFEISKGEYIVLLDHDDYLSPDALYEVVKTVNKYRDVDFLYSDRVIFSNETNKIIGCHYLPAFSPDLLRAYNYASHLNGFSRWVIDRAGFEREGYDGSQDYDFELRVVESSRRIVNIPRVLYFCRASEGSVAFNPGSKMYAYEAGRKAIGEHINRIGYPGEVEFLEETFSYKINYIIKDNKRVSIIIPNKDHASDLERCLKSIVEKTSYMNFDINVIENNSETEGIFPNYERMKKEYKINVLNYPDKGFNFSAINNWASDRVEGDYLVLLNNDTQVISGNWLEEMLMFAQRGDIGAVGAKLYYPDDTIQHAGLVIGLGGSIASHYDYRKSRYEAGYMNRLLLPQNYTAVTAACLMVKKEDYKKVNGLDEVNFKIGLNDVDFCLKLREIGKTNVLTPYAELYHFESVSRGLDETGPNEERYKTERDYFRKKWEKYFLNGDPYDNPGILAV